MRYGVSQKEGANYGRPYFSCPQARGSQCDNTFRWADVGTSTGAPQNIARKRVAVSPLPQPAPKSQRTDAIGLGRRPAPDVTHATLETMTLLLRVMDARLSTIELLLSTQAHRSHVSSNQLPINSSLRATHAVTESEVMRDLNRSIQNACEEQEEYV
jgi:hypothetical protein